MVAEEPEKEEAEKKAEEDEAAAVAVRVVRCACGVTRLVFLPNRHHHEWYAVASVGPGQGRGGGRG